MTHSTHLVRAAVLATVLIACGTAALGASPPSGTDTTTSPSADKPSAPGGRPSPWSLSNEPPAAGPASSAADKQDGGKSKSKSKGKHKHPPKRASSPDSDPSDPYAVFGHEPGASKPH